MLEILLSWWQLGDYYTRWMEPYAIPNQVAVTVAQKLVDELFCRFSPPEQLHSDQGCQFESEVIKESAGDFTLKRPGPHLTTHSLMGLWSASTGHLKVFLRPVLRKTLFRGKNIGRKFASLITPAFKPLVDSPHITSCLAGKQSPQLISCMGDHVMKVRGWSLSMFAT